MDEQLDAGSRLAAARADIAAACREARRDPTSVTLVAVSKTFGAAAIMGRIDISSTYLGKRRIACRVEPGNDDQEIYFS